MHADPKTLLDADVGEFLVYLNNIFSHFTQRVCSTANWLLDTEVDLEASETGSTKSADFDLGVWREALKPAATARRLYFL